MNYHAAQVGQSPEDYNGPSLIPYYHYPEMQGYSPYYSPNPDVQIYPPGVNPGSYGNETVQIYGGSGGGGYSSYGYGGYASQNACPSGYTSDMYGNCWPASAYGAPSYGTPYNQSCAPCNCPSAAPSSRRSYNRSARPRMSGAPFFWKTPPFNPKRPKRR